METWKLKTSRLICLVHVKPVLGARLVFTWLDFRFDPLPQLGKLLALFARLGVEVDGLVVVVEADEVATTFGQAAANADVDLEGWNDEDQLVVRCGVRRLDVALEVDGEVRRWVELYVGGEDESGRGRLPGNVSSRVNPVGMAEMREWVTF